MDKFNELKEVLANTEVHVTKFAAGNQAAGTRVRKAMLEVIALAKALRVEVQEIKNKE